MSHKATNLLWQSPKEWCCKNKITWFNFPLGNVFIKLSTEKTEKTHEWKTYDCNNFKENVIKSILLITAWSLICLNYVWTWNYIEFIIMVYMLLSDGHTDYDKDLKTALLQVPYIELLTSLIFLIKSWHSWWKCLHINDNKLELAFLCNYPSPRCPHESTVILMNHIILFFS